MGYEDEMDDEDAIEIILKEMISKKKKNRLLGESEDEEKEDIEKEQ